MLIESFSGIRGVYKKDLTSDIAQKYAYAYFIAFLKQNPNSKIVIGRDSRESGKEIFNTITKSLDCEILDLGISPTQIIENAVRSFQCDGGIIITASHNEPEYNGFKFLDKDGAVLNQNNINKVIETFRNLKESDIQINLNNQSIENYHYSALGSYIGFTRNILGPENLNQVKILIDPNGGAGICSKKVFEEFNVDATYVNTEIGKFNRLIEPNLKSLSYLKPKVTETNASFVAGFDCDADRVEILLPNGKLIDGNEILALIAQEILTPGDNCVVNDATSYLVKNICNTKNCNFIEVEVGETNIITEMSNKNSKVGGEGSNGGVIIKESKCRDGILATLYLLKIILNKNSTLEELISKLPKYHYIKEKIKLEKDFQHLRPKLEEHYSSKDFKIQKTGDETGGLKFIKDNSWIWFRQSKTEDKILRIIADSKDEDVSNNLLSEAKELLNNY